MTSKKTLSILLAALLTASMGVSAFAADGTKEATAGGEVTAAVKVKNPIISVTVPTTMDVLLDTFQSGDKSGSQIFSAYQPVVNKSNVPINITFQAKVEPKDGVTVVSTAADAKPASDSDKANKIYVAMAPIASVKPNTNSTGIDLTGVGSEDGSYAKNPQASITTKKNNAMTFSLAAATYDTSSPPAFKEIAVESTKVTGAGAFRFMGTMNQNGTWADDSIVIKPTYEIKGVLADDFKALKPLASTANVSVLTNGTFGPSVESTADEIAAFDPTAAFDLALDMGTGTDAATKVASVKAGTTALAAADFTFAMSTPSDPTDTTAKISFTAAGSAKINGKTITITFDKGNPKTLDVTFPAK